MENVLPFRIDYLNTVRCGQRKRRPGSCYRYWKSNVRARAHQRMTSYILEHFDQKNKAQQRYSLKGQRVAASTHFRRGFYPDGEEVLHRIQEAAWSTETEPYDCDYFQLLRNQEDPEDVLPDEVLKRINWIKLRATSLCCHYDTTRHLTSLRHFVRQIPELLQRPFHAGEKPYVDLLIVVNMFLTALTPPHWTLSGWTRNLRHTDLFRHFPAQPHLKFCQDFRYIICFRDLNRQPTKLLLSSVIKKQGNSPAENIWWLLQRLRWGRQA